MNPAALPPIQPSIRAADREHPWFPIYMAYRSGCSIQLIEADSFADWKAHREAEERQQHIRAHPCLPEFQRWMAEVQGGARPCPAGNFPNNFRFWLEGGRW